jgi:hypothetical protein
MSLDVCKNLKHLLIITFWGLLAISATGKRAPTPCTSIGEVCIAELAQKATACDDVI